MAVYSLRYSENRPGNIANDVLPWIQHTVVRELAELGYRSSADLIRRKIETDKSLTGGELEALRSYCRNEDILVDKLE
ncbi:MAG: hypothetical protein HYU56_01360 [Candidatus Aenigmarchaeota archaeon]|nr:hypothetical protein [Candidatus Aenigmarchaeota archaeon]